MRLFSGLPLTRINKSRARNPLQQGSFVAIILAVACLLLPVHGLASITGVQVGASPANVTFNNPATVVVTWQVSTVLAPSTKDTITSPAGVFLGPTAIGGNAKTLSKSFTVSLAGTDSTTITEIVRVPSSVSYKANKNGEASFSYFRFFSDSDGVGSGLGGSVTINIKGSSGGGLALSRLELRFDTDEIVRIAAQNEKLTAIAEINYSGAGLLDAVWEVADPSSTRGDPVFVPVRILRKYLGAGRNVILQSPPLPTAVIGTHFVRLRINQPADGIEFPVLTYQVNKQIRGGKPEKDLAMIRLRSPQPGARYAAATEFSWQAMEGARAYQLEIHAADIAETGKVADRSLEDPEVFPDPALNHRPPVTGILLPAAHTSARLSALSRQHLQQQRRYLWRVIAIGHEGSVIASSEMQEINVP